MTEQKMPDEVVIDGAVIRRDASLEIRGIPENWTARRLGDLAFSVASGRTTAFGAVGAFPVYGSTGVIGYAPNGEYSGPAVLVARVGANAGKLNAVCGQYGVTDNTIILRLGNDQCLPFVLLQLELFRLNRLVFGSGQPLITGTQLKELIVTCPPLPEQRAIAAVLSDVDALLVALDRLIAKKRDLKRAAMQQLLTGRTRLSGFGDRERWGGQATRGRAPDTWRASTIGEFAHLSSGTTPPRSLADRYYRGGIIPWVKTLDLNNALISHTDERVTPLAMKETSLRAYPPGTVLVAMYGGFNQIGRTGLLQISAAVNQAITAIQLKNSEVCPEFLLAVLNLRVGYWKTIASSSRKDPNIASQDIRRFPLAYPEIAEQTAIAAVLSDMDAEITALEQRRDKTRLLKQGMMQELLTGRIRLV
jgi:type I restriction enzyme, S subunit